MHPGLTGLAYRVVLDNIVEQLQAIKDLGEDKIYTVDKHTAESLGLSVCGSVTLIKLE